MVQSLTEVTLLAAWTSQNARPAAFLGLDLSENQNRRHRREENPDLDLISMEIFWTLQCLEGLRNGRH